MDTLLFFKAVLIGLSIAAPVGPIGLLCIQRTLAHGARVGFVSGLGAAAADGVYGAIGAFGLVAVTQFFVALATPLAVFGAVFLGWMGVQLLRADPAGTMAAGAAAPAAGRAFLSVFALTLSNPMTILSFIAVFAAMGGAAGAAPASAGLMLAGVASGSALWWLTLTLGVSAARRKMDARAMRAINRTAGLLLLGFALWQACTVLR
ncbi:LysE family translocator [Janthinobacterium fluminis]|uniref:LysE family transporter n=1 Tax=Janthinobacterium fluminis TaxID=2987524 RepID=A0ABT5K5V2_9BURK|nr:LysE family transporter [Janthinobacterium fluminis]MDC8760370.1 LysE family transporter [Janthinobacterium fluminis]